MSNTKSGWKKLTSMRLFLPIVCLIAVLLVNVITTPGFFKVSINNGVLYGYIVDVINRASELVILAVGMTLVTAASGGQDISVGAVMAVAAAVCCQILSGGEVSVNSLAAPIIVAMLAALAASALCGAFNGFLVAKLNIQPMVATLILYTAGRGIAQLITDGQITYIRVKSYQVRWIYRKMPGSDTNLYCYYCCSDHISCIKENSTWSLHRKCRYQWYSIQTGRS